MGTATATATSRRHAAEVRRHFSIRAALGPQAWGRLPAPVRARFADAAGTAEYRGTFQTVRASRAGRLLGQLCRLLGSPVAPYTGREVPATVRVYDDGRGGRVWERIYHFPGRPPCRVVSTKRAGARGELIEALPCRLRMALRVMESGGGLHFISCGYYFSLGPVRLPVPRLLPPGLTHVEHYDEGDGWFRFTMTVRHRWLGEVFYQTGRFRAASEVP
jgi:hypothetical protein